MIKFDTQDAAGDLQICAGQEAGCEAAIHAMCLIFQKTVTEGVLLVDATNAFNSLNRKEAVLNIHCLCLSLTTILTNTYKDNVQLSLMVKRYTHVKEPHPCNGNV